MSIKYFYLFFILRVERVMKTYSAKARNIKRKWCVVDATDKILGRLASNIAARLRGKHKPVYTSHVDTGDFIIVVNADKVRLTGKKWSDKLYHHHTGYIGGLKTASAEELLSKKPEELIRHAVRGMLPKNSLGRTMLRKLKVYTGADHPHQAQQPEALSI
jgi:large subunit ribosomal protein L13